MIIGNNGSSDIQIITKTKQIMRTIEIEMLPLITRATLYAKIWNIRDGWRVNQILAKIATIARHDHNIKKKDLNAK